MAVYVGGTGDANKFDDFEEGTFTPVVASIASPSYTVQAGRYTKMGHMVHAQAYILMASGGGLGAIFSIAGLPFTSTSADYKNGGGYVICDNGFLDSTSGSALNSSTCWVSGNATNVRFYTRHDGDSIYANATAFGTGANNRYLIVQVQYEAA